MIQKIEIKNYKIFIDGKPLKESDEDLARPFFKKRSEKTYYFHKKKWRNSRP